jgi:short-subunit dehydrogenase
VTRPLADRLAVVTGASSGIGLATARALASAGARLVLVARSEARLETASQEIARMAGGGPAALSLPCDVSDPEAVRRMAEQVGRDAGTPDLVVNSAGIGHWAPVVELPLERIRAVLAVNFFGAVHCTKAFLPAMLARGRGTMVFVSSGFGELPFPFTGAYCASKHALNGFAGSLRAEVEPLGVHVLLALPGSTRTGFFEANAYPAGVLSRYLLQRSVAPDEVAARIVRAVIRDRRRLVVGWLNGVGLRLAGALPELEAVALAWIGRRLLRDRAAGAGGDRESG